MAGAGLAASLGAFALLATHSTHIIQTNNNRMKRILLVPALAALIASSATAGMTITWTETNTALTGTFSGSISAGQLANTVKWENDTSNHYMDSATFYSATGKTDWYYSSMAYNWTTLPTRSPDSFNSWNQYSGNSGTGDNFGFRWGSGPSFSLYVPVGYVAGTPISGSLTIPYSGGTLLNDHPLSLTTFGDIITLAGAPLVTYVNGNSISAVPEVTSSFTMLGLLTSGLLLRRRGRKAL